jgi:hypothetical protein
MSGGGTLALGSGNLTVAGSVELGGGATLRMGAGNVFVGRSNAGVGIKADGGSTIVTGGGAYFSVIGPINIPQGTVNLGGADYRVGNDGSSNCATMPSANCDSITFNSGTLTFGNGPFSANGNLKMANSGTINIGATATHYINGSMIVTGPMNFGAGEYVINGSLTNNTSGKMSGANVTFILRDALTLSGAAGLTITAPSDSTGGGLPSILFASKANAATKISGGSNNIMAGVFYIPNSDLTLDGGASITSNGACLNYIVSTLTLNGGTTAATTCTGGGSGTSTSGTIALVQ